MYPPATPPAAFDESVSQGGDEGEMRGVPHEVTFFAERGGSGKERLRGVSCDLVEARGGTVIMCLSFNTLPSLLMVLALDSESLGSPKVEGSEALGDGEGGEFWFPEKWISGSSCGVWVGVWRALLVSLVAFPSRFSISRCNRPLFFSPFRFLPTSPPLPPAANLGTPFGVYPGTLRTQPRRGGF